jgi:CRISPR-associated protein Cas1
MGEVPPLKPVPIKERHSMLFIEKGNLDVVDGAFVVIDKSGIRTHIPIGMVTCLMLEPGIRISHAAVKLAAAVGCLLVWVGEAGVRLYAAGNPGGARTDRLLYQAKLALDESLRLRVVRKMYEMRFSDPPPLNRSVNQLRGIEAARVKQLYKDFAKRYGVKWEGRRYDPRNWQEADIPNRSLSSATACLYGITEAAILTAGYAPGIGFLHSGRPQAFVYDIADILKFETVVPIAFEVASTSTGEVEKEVRHRCRDAFRSSNTLKRLIPLIEEVLAAGGLEVPEASPVSTSDDDAAKKGGEDASGRD